MGKDPFLGFEIVYHDLRNCDENSLYPDRLGSVFVGCNAEHRPVLCTIIKTYVLVLDQTVRLHRLGAVSVIGVEFPLQSTAKGKAYNREEHKPGLCAASAVVYAPIDTGAAISIYEVRRELK
jgi:hypothetical protein